MKRTHRYQPLIRWTGNLGSGTLDYRAYSRDHEISLDGKLHTIQGSSDPLFRGDLARYNPEELFVSSLACCHMLWYLHLAAVNGIVVLAYSDRPEGVMEEDEDGAGRFTIVQLNPEVTIASGGNRELAESLHAEAGKKCFLANSVAFPVVHRPSIRSRGVR